MKDSQFLFEHHDQQTKGGYVAADDVVVQVLGLSEVAKLKNDEENPGIVDLVELQDRPGETCTGSLSLLLRASAFHFESSAEALCILSDELKP